MSWELTKGPREPGSVVREFLERDFPAFTPQVHWPDGRITQARQALASITERIVPTVILDVVKDDPDDNRILECAQSAHSDWIVTGDKDLLRLGGYDGMAIVTVTDFLARFAASQPRLGTTT